MAIILITGGTGLIGKMLCKHLIEENHEVRILSRNPKSTSSVKSFYWNVENQEIDEAAFDGVEHIVHLAGTNIAEKSWSTKRKKEIIDSRVNSIKLITSVIKKKALRLKSFAGASAIGIYGMITSEKIFSETDTGQNDFLSHSCTEWENSYKDITKIADKTVVLRIGVVLSKQGGALKKLNPLFKLGLGSAVGSGKQYMPWIHIEDVVSVFHEALFNVQLNGVYNAVASEHITNHQFSIELAKSLSKPFFMPNVPAFLLKLMYGDMANVILTGSRVSNTKICDAGFKFRYPTITEALLQENKKPSKISKNNYTQNINDL